MVNSGDIVYVDMTSVLTATVLGDVIFKNTLFLYLV